jgi:hypothetical protein
VTRTTPGTSPATRPATEPSPPGAPPVADNGNRLWLVPLRVRVRTEAGELVDYGTLRAREMRWASEQLVSGGPGQPDVLWTPWSVRFWGNDDVIEPGLTLPPGTPLRLRDVKSDGQRVWAATTTEGIWVLDRRGKAVAQIGPEDGLPPADTALYVLPLPDGRVFATGSFGNDNRGWCALIEADFDGAGRLRGRPRVQVIHKGTAVSHNTPPATRPFGHDGLSRAVLPADWSYIPTPIGLFPARNAVGGGLGPAAAGGRPGPYVLVGRAFDNDDPLVFDLSPGGPPAVSLLEAPLMLEDRPAAHGSSIWADSLLEVGSAAIARYALKVEAAAAAADGRGVLTAPREPQILCRRRWEPPERGQRSRTDIWAVLPAPDGLYALSGDCAFRIDPATFACERVAYDPELLRTGRINCWGVSERRGPLLWGDEMCRVIIAREPPAGALEAKTVVGAEGEIRVLCSGTAPTPSGTALMQHDVRQ